MPEEQQGYGVNCEPGPGVTERPVTKEEADIIRRFTYHAPKGDQAQRYGEIRRKAQELAFFLLNACPDSREKSLAMTKLEEAIMWANASIARNE